MNEAMIVEFIQSLSNLNYDFDQLLELKSVLIGS